MATAPGNRRPHFARSPFEPYSAPVVEEYVLDDRVCHDAYGLGRVVGVDAGGVTVDFSPRTVRVATPFRRMTKL
jgi:predicted metal-dependent phosphoesterase TrpH